jgi:uncharacterized protein YraI
MIKTSIRVAGLGLATALAGGLVAATPAQAADGYEGTVTATNLTVRYGPTTASTSEGLIAKGEVIPLVCQIRGTSVGGNNIWYALPPTLNEWVSARYVDTLDTPLPWCGTSARFTGKTTARVTKRTGPTTAASSAGHVAKGSTVTIICKLPGKTVKGNNRWYYLTDGRWVAARYVANVGAAPGWCN